VKRYIVFVYGTLKSGFSNHHYLDGSDYLGAGKTVEKYALYFDGLPFVIRHESVTHIHGELYAIDTPTLNTIDRLESHPDWYNRQEVEIVTDEGKRMAAWLYFYPEKRGKLMKTGRYTKS
jgi:gamma-glutamylaminecyclotransferase